MKFPMLHKFTYKGRAGSLKEMSEGGPKLLFLEKFHDERGEFLESFNQGLFLQLDLPYKWAQDNLAYSKAGVIRGMHFQTVAPQGKLVTCLHGSIFDVCINLSDYSPGQAVEAYTAVLNAQSTYLESFYIPPGWAHGYLSLEDSIVAYKCTTLHNKESDAGINPMLSDIPWPEMPNGYVISEKDSALPSLVDYLNQV